MNLLVELKENLTDSVVSRAAYYVDENPVKTRVALEGLIHTVVAGLMKRTTTEIGVNQLYNAIQKGKFDGNLVATFPELLRDPEQTTRLAEIGQQQHQPPAAGDEKRHRSGHFRLRQHQKLGGYHVAGPGHAAGFRNTE
jgi:hypothetical protein